MTHKHGDHSGKLRSFPKAKITSTRMKYQLRNCRTSEILFLYRSRTEKENFPSAKKTMPCALGSVLRAADMTRSVVHEGPDAEAVRDQAKAQPVLSGYRLNDLLT